MPLADFMAARDVLLRSWWVASDGRLYHDVLVDRVKDMLSKRENNRQRQSRKRAKVATPEPGHSAATPKTAEQMSKDELWAAGKSLLSGAGVPVKQAGSAIGKLIKQYTEPVVLDAVREACVSRPADPMPYLVGLCERATGRRKSQQATIEGRNFNAVESWATS